MKVYVFLKITILFRKKHVRLIEKFEGFNGSFRTAFQHFVMEAVVLVGMENLIMLMRRMKCFDIANMLIHAKNGIVVEILVGQSMGVSEEILKYHSRLKTDMDNNVFADRKLEFERRAKELVASFSRIADLEEKTFEVHKFAVVTFLRTTLYRDKESRDAILNEMRNSVPDDVDRTFVDLIYKGNMAKTAIYVGDEELAKKYIQEALVMGENCQESFVKVFTYHDQQQVYRCLYSMNPDAESMKNVSVVGQAGQAILQDLSEEKSKIWRKVFVSETTMSLLKINRTFEVLVTEPVADQDRIMADQLLKALDTQTKSSEKRRDMLVYLCKARILEVDNPLLAKAYARKAKDYAKDGSFYPLDFLNISNYYKHLCHHTVPKMLASQPLMAR